MSARQLALEIDRVLLHARRRARLIDEVDVGAGARQQARGCCPTAATEAARERVGQRHRSACTADCGDEVLFEKPIAPYDVGLGAGVVPRRPAECRSRRAPRSSS